MTAGLQASLHPLEHTSVGSDPPAPSLGAPTDPPLLPRDPKAQASEHEATPAFPCLGELLETLSAPWPSRSLAQTVVGPPCLHHPDIRPHSFRRWWPPLAWSGHRALLVPPHPARGLRLCPPLLSQMG